MRIQDILSTLPGPTYLDAKQELSLPQAFRARRLAREQDADVKAVYSSPLVSTASITSYVWR